MEALTEIHIHVLNNFQVSIPLASDSNGFVFTQTTSPSFGLTLTRVDTQESFHYQIQMVQLNGSSEEIVSSGLVWAKRTPYQFQKQQNTSIIEALVCTVKVPTGVFDFRRNKDRSIRFVVRCFSNDVLLSTGVSQICRIHPKKRLADEESEENNNAVIPICWLLDAPQQNSAEECRSQSEEFHSSPEQHDEDSIMANLNDSEDRLQSYSNEGDSDDLLLMPAAYVDYTGSELQPMMPNDEAHQYMVLYNGNAEVIGNFRALNFYKASDVRIKEDVQLLLSDDRDPRSVLLKIDGVEYKFKQGTVHHASMNKRFVGYIAQQIESVVPEAVQLIDGILHVDYESLIPYLSESIKQNFKDITEMKADASQIHQVIDMLYKEFVNMDKTKRADKQSTSTTSEQTKNRGSVRWIISASLTVLLLVSVVIGMVFIVPLVHETSNINNIQSPNTVPPSDPPNNPPSTSPNETPTPTFPSPDQHILVEFYHATGGANWLDKDKASPSTSVCEWPGVTCNNNSRVISIVREKRGLVGTIPDSIGKLDKLTTLRLRANKLFGTIPASIGNITGLVELDLRWSQFTGSVPLEIFSLASLSTLDVSDNINMSWTIPPQISNMKELQNLIAQSSGLHGTIPNEISQMTSLSWLMLGSNDLTGTVPSLANTSVYQLHLEYNQLSGSIPKLNEKVFANPQGRRANVELTSNNFSGEIDVPVEFLTHTNYLGLQHNKFTGVSSRLENITMQAGCVASDNPFKCPIPQWLKTWCQASCT